MPYVVRIAYSGGEDASKGCAPNSVTNSPKFMEQYVVLNARLPNTAAHVLDKTVSFDDKANYKTTCAWILQSHGHLKL